MTWIIMIPTVLALLAMIGLCLFVSFALALSNAPSKSWRWTYVCRILCAGAVVWLAMFAICVLVRKIV
jgi:hypothetical protein